MNASKPSTALDLKQLPEAISRYITAANQSDSRGIAHCFTDDAVVKDEGKDRRGIAAIVAWKDETTEKYHAVTEALSASQRGDTTLLTARVSGDFTGSPVNLKYAFTLQGGKISHLEIVA